MEARHGSAVLTRSPLLLSLLLGLLLLLPLRGE